MHRNVEKENRNKIDKTKTSLEKGKLSPYTYESTDPYTVKNVRKKW